MRVIVSDVPVAFEPLLKPARYKGAYGGRGGAKSHFFAERLALRALVEPIRAVCIREVQQSLRDSSRQLIVDKIQHHGLGDRFEILDAEIRGRNGSQGSNIIFRGMQSYNAETIKSLEGYDIAWTEEAQTLSSKSLKMLRPTLRKQGSELWFSWNPRHRTDPVDEFFRGKNPHPEAVSVRVNWRDNPWFPDELRRDMEYDKANDPDDAEHIWEGAYGVSQGSILGRWVDAADRDGRINDAVAFDPESPIEISSDIGFRDTASWWFWQPRIGGCALLDYMGEKGRDADDLIELLQERLTERDWPLGKIWLPHDAKAKSFQSKHSVVERFITAFGTTKVGVVPQSKKMDQINAARRVLPKCEFHRARCAEGLDGLRAWEYEYDEEQQVFSKNPLHNWASHPSDAFAYGAQVMAERIAPAPIEKPQIKTVNVGTRSTVTLEDLWEEDARERSGWRSRWV